MLGEDILVTTYNGDCAQNSQIFRINVTGIPNITLNAPTDTACSGGILNCHGFWSLV